MKKQRILVMICIVSLWLVSCVKDNETPITKIKKIDKTSTAQLLKRLKTNTFEGSYLLSSRIGHKSTVCGGKCTYTNGVWLHVNCQGFGNECDFIARINIFKNIPNDLNDIYYTAFGINDYEPTQDETFNMPARSLYIQNEAFENGFIYLNIPEQILQRDEESNQFIYKDITFTTTSIFENL